MRGSGRHSGWLRVGHIGESRISGARPSSAFRSSRALWTRLAVRGFSTTTVSSRVLARWRKRRLSVGLCLR